MIRASAQHARPPPLKATRVLLARPHVGFAGNLPASIYRRVVETEWLVRRTHSPKWCHIRRLKHGCFEFGLVFAPGLEHQDFCPIHAQRVGGLSAGGSGSDYDDVVAALLCPGRYKG